MSSEKSLKKYYPLVLVKFYHCLGAEGRHALDEHGEGYIGGDA